MLGAELLIWMANLLGGRAADDQYETAFIILNSRRDILNQNAWNSPEWEIVQGEENRALKADIIQKFITPIHWRTVSRVKIR